MTIVMQKLSKSIITVACSLLLFLGIALQAEAFGFISEKPLEDSTLNRLRYHQPLKVLKETKGWVSNKGNGFFKLGESFISAKKFFNPNGESIAITTTRLYITSFYGEYGISNRVTAVAYVPLFFRVTLNETRFRPSNDFIAGDAVNSVGDIDAGVKIGIIRNKPFVMSVGLIFGIPAGNNAGGNTQLLQTGDGEFNQLFNLNAGYGQGKSFFGATLGFNHRTRGFSEEFRFGAEAGVNFSKHLTGILKIDGIESFKNGEVLDATNGIFSNNVEFILLTPELDYTFNNTLGISANAGIPLRGENTVNAPVFSLGIFYKLQKNSQ